MVGIDDVVGFTGASAAELAGSMWNSRLAESRQHDAQDFSAGQFANRYQIATRDLMAAGLNPMLAYMQGPGSAPQSSAASASGVSASEVYNQHRIASSVEALNVANAEKAIAEKENVRTDTMSKLQLPAYWQAKTLEAANTATKTDALERQITEVEIPKVKQEIINLKKQASKTDSDIELNKSIMDANAVLSGLRSVQAYLHGMEGSKISMEKDIMLPKVKASQDWSAEAGFKSEQRSKIWQEDWRFINPFAH